MRNLERIPVVLAAVWRLWRKHPDLRLGQLIVVLAAGNWRHNTERPARLTFYIEDDELVRRIEEELDA